MDQELVTLLRCPGDRAELNVSAKALTCKECGRRYPIEDDIPVMLLSAATKP